MDSIQLTLGEFTVSLCANKSEFAGLTHFGEAAVVAEYEFQPGEKAMLDGPPENCQPGSPDSVALWNVQAVEPMVFFAEGLTLTIDAGQDIFHLLSRYQVERMEDDILKSVHQEAFA